jgi:hypothetical protein
MARQHTTSQGLESSVGAALVGLGLVMLFWKLGGPAAQLANLVATAARETLELLPFLVPAVRQALQVYTFDHQWFPPCLVQMLLSFWPLLHGAAGAL